MTARDPYPSGVDPCHIWAVCAAAAPGHDPAGTAVLAGGRDAARVYLPARAAARAAQAALSRVGYQVARAAGSSRGRQLLVRGWSAGGLEARLTAMRAVLEQLAADPGSAATMALDQLRRVPAAELPAAAGQQQLTWQAGEQLRRWIFAASGIHAPHDPLARPADTGCALRLSAAWRLEEAIDDLAARQLRVAGRALALYPALRQQIGHDSARDTVIRQAGITFHLSSPIAQDTTPLLRNAGRAPGLGASAPAQPAPAASPSARPGTWPGPRAAPVTGTPAGPASSPPSTAAARPRGRNFPSGRAGGRP
jgi:hypothetical protein